MLLRDFASYLRERKSDPTLHIVNRSDLNSEEAGTALPAPEAKIGSASVVEGDRLDSKPVGEPGNSGFTHFLDGIQRTHLPCYWSIAPTLYGYTAAAIRTRNTDRKMATWRTENCESLYFPFAHCNPADLRGRGISATNTYEDGETVDEHPAAMLDRARKAVSRSLARLERDMARDWLSKHTEGDAWLLRDGDLTEIVDSAEPVQIVGVVKSHQTQYFGMEDQKKILALDAGERSSVFKILGRKRMGAYSWYLRLRPNAGRDLYFGLVRIEAPPVPRSIEMADEISRWLLAERSPISLPDSRWDRLIYPIRDCEQYLRSLAPSRVMMEAAFSGF